MSINTHTGLAFQYGGNVRPLPFPKEIHSIRFHIDDEDEDEDGNPQYKLAFEVLVGENQAALIHNKQSSAVTQEFAENFVKTLRRYNEITTNYDGGIAASLATCVEEAWKAASKNLAAKILEQSEASVELEDAEEEEEEEEDDAPWWKRLFCCHYTCRN